MTEYDSGPYCRHWSDPSDCRDLCTCGHACWMHEYYFENSACMEDGCKCKEWVEPEPPEPPHVHDITCEHVKCASCTEWKAFKEFGPYRVCTVCWSHAGCCHRNMDGDVWKIGDTCCRCGFKVPMDREMTDFEIRCAI